VACCDLKAATALVVEEKARVLNFTRSNDKNTFRWLGEVAKVRTNFNKVRKEMIDALEGASRASVVCIPGLNTSRMGSF